MLTPKPQLNLNNAKEYFREHLCVGDYYAEGQSVTGEWLGLGAEQLNLKGKVGEAEFLRLCDGLHPMTGDRLTQRMNSSRQTNDGRTVANRRVFYDFTISPPKSVSIVALLKDDRILQIHDQAVKLAMVELEKFSEARVRIGGERSERLTGNMVTAAFLHETSRELDPHLHTHCVVFNATFDRTENRWKALEVQGMFRAQKFAENLYYHELAKGLRRLGYEIVNNIRDFEIKGVETNLVSVFSKRHHQINKEAKSRIQKGGGDANTVRRQVAHEARKRKIKSATADTLRPSWWAQLSDKEQEELKNLRPVVQAFAPGANVNAVVQWADEHLFERRSVIKDFELWSASLARGRGEDFDLGTLHETVVRRDYVREKGTRKITSREVLKCELDIVLAAKNGRMQHGALSPGYIPAKTLSPEQQKAARKILESRDFISLFRGGAGTGKSFTLKEIDRGLHLSGRSVVVLAPQRQQVCDLQSEGLAAETVAGFLEKSKITEGAVVIVDEAGQIGGRQLRQLIQLVQANSGRIILSGDSRQHGAVAASDALRAIEKHARLKPTIIQIIRRQNPKLGKTAKERGFIRSYRAAVKAASKGKILESYDRLDRLACIRQFTPETRREGVAEEFMAAAGRNEKVLVVAQTREEMIAVNDVIRLRLRDSGKLGSNKSLSVFRPVDLSDAQKRDPRFYQPGQKVFFMKPYGRFKKGDLCDVAGVSKRGLVVLKDGRRSPFSYRYTDRIVVTTTAPMEIAAGDRLQIKFNGKSVEGASLNNGELVTVRQIRCDGALIVQDDSGARKTLSAEQRIFVRGYAVTSYASQGKTVDTVIMADAENRAATNAEQWYVTISRARKRAVVFTSNKEALRMSVESRGARELALDSIPISDAIRETGCHEKVKADSWRTMAIGIIEQVRCGRFIAGLRETPRVKQNQSHKI